MEAPSISLSQMGASVALAVLERMRSFFDALATIARASGGGAFARGAPGFRSVQVPAIEAPVLGADGKLLVDDDGRPALCHFEVIQANVEPDGFLTLDLTTADREYHQTEGSSYQAAAALAAGGVRLELPGGPIDEQGRVTFTGLLPEAVAVEQLPLFSFDVTIRGAL